MDKKIFYNGDQVYHVVRTIKVSDCDPRQYGINRSDEAAYMKVLKAWVESHHCDHVLRQHDSFLLCRTIKDAEIIE